MAKRYGYKAIELFFEDLEALAAELAGGQSAENQILAADRIRTMCEDRDIAILCLQPFSNTEGLKDREERARRLHQLKFWFQLARVLGTNMIQIPSTFQPESQMSGDMDLIVADLQEVADLGLQQTPPIRYVFEALSFGTHINTWEQSWEVIQRVDRPNFGLCLDTFNIAGRIYADPASATGLADKDNADKGYEGWVSLELFNRRMADEGKDIPEELARRGAASWTKLVRDLKLKVDVPQDANRVIASL